MSSGLLMRSAGRVPIDAEDVLAWLSQDETFCVIGYRRQLPIGYVVGIPRYMEHQVRELFCLQVYNDGTREEADAGMKMLQKLAGMWGCTRLGTMLPLDIPWQAHLRRYGWTPQAVYATKAVTVAWA